MLEKLYKDYKDRAAFFIIYISEAHPGQTLPTGEGKGEKVAYDQTKTVDERSKAAKACLNSLKLSVPFLLDGMNKAVEKSYSGWPNRIFVIDKDGKVAMKGPHGPQGADIEGARKKLEEILSADKK